jgi:hypothetical protein
MNEVVRWTSRDLARSGRGGLDLRSGMAGAVGGLVMTLALAVAAAVAVVFAATLAVIMALATALLALSALAWRMRPRAQRALVRTPRGHAWVAYGWERTSR